LLPAALRFPYNIDTLFNNSQCFCHSIAVTTLVATSAIQCLFSEPPTHKAVDSEFSSIQLNSSALHAGSNDQSLMSSLKVVDLPGLDTSGDNRSTPMSGQKPFSQSRCITVICNVTVICIQNRID